MTAPKSEDGRPHPTTGAAAPPDRGSLHPSGRRARPEASLRLDRAFEPRYGEAVAVAPGVRRLTAANAGPFTFRGTNTFLVGHGPIAVIDPGPADPAHLDAVLAAIGGAQVSHILISHRHSDHVAGADLLQRRTDAPTYAAVRRRRPPEEPGSVALDAAADRAFRPDQVLEDAMVLQAGGQAIEIIATPGHASDHVAFALPDAGVLLPGDHVMGWSTTVVAPPDGSMAEYMASLDRLLQRDEVLYLPAHGGEIRDAHAFVRGLRAHRRMREAAILDAVRQGAGTLTDVVARVYPDIAPALAGAAALSARAHLDHLAARGAIVTAEAGRAQRYRAAVADSG